MRLYLSSYRLGNEPHKFASMVTGNKRTGIIMNARDYFSEEDRASGLKSQIDDLITIGLDPDELDLRNYYGDNERLEQHLDDYDALWVPGGNSFLLRRVMYDTGFDSILKKSLKKDKLVYAGYSAGIVVLSPTLKGIEIVDDDNMVYDVYKSKPVFEGLDIISYSIAPHYKSEHPETELIDKVVDFFIEENMHFKTLKDGHAIIVNGDKEEFIM